MNDLELLGKKSISFWIIIACFIGLGSLGISIQPENDNLALKLETIEMDPAINGQTTEIQNTTEVADLSVLAPELPTVEEPSTTEITVNDSSNAGLSIITGVTDKTLTAKQKPIVTFTSEASVNTPLQFGISNDSEDAQVYLVTARTETYPETPINMEIVNSANKIHQSLEDGWWFIEVKTGSTAELQIETLASRSDPYAIEVRVERAFSLLNNYFEAPIVTGVTSSIEIKEKLIAGFEVDASNSIHLTWGIDNNTVKEQVYLIKLETEPEMLINLELIGNSSTRIYQKTVDGHFLTVVRPSLSGDKFFSALSGPNSFTIKGEVERFV